MVNVFFLLQSGEGVPTSLKGKYSRHTTDVARFFRVSDSEPSSSFLLETTNSVFLAMYSIHFSSTFFCKTMWDYKDRR